MWRRNREAPSELFDEAYRYDGLYQIKALDRGKLNQNRTAIGGAPTKGERWEYDEMGNWLNYLPLANGVPGTERPATYNAANELLFLSGSNTSIGYDAAGNMTKTPLDGHRLKWDAWNRLVEVANIASVPLGKYAYDGLSRRISKQTGFPSAPVTRHFYYSDRWQVLEERLDNSPNAERQFVWGLQGLDDLICRDELNTSTSTGALTRRLWAVNDGKNVTAIALGNDVVERYAYGAFGKPELLKPDLTPRSPIDPDFPDYGWETLFCGYRWDQESLLYQVRYRYYQPELGRWLSRDPLQDYYVPRLTAFEFARGVIDSYTYCQNMPVGLLDPEGLSGTNLEDQKDDIPEYVTVDQWPKNLPEELRKKLIEAGVKQGVKCYTVLGHGSSGNLRYGGRSYAGIDAGDFISNRPNYKKGSPIILFICNPCDSTSDSRPGTKPTDLGQTISDQLGVPVAGASCSIIVSSFFNSKTETHEVDSIKPEREPSTDRSPKEEWRVRTPIPNPK